MVPMANYTTVDCLSFFDSDVRFRFAPIFVSFCSRIASFKSGMFVCILVCLSEFLLERLMKTFGIYSPIFDMFLPE